MTETVVVPPEDPAKVASIDQRRAKLREWLTQKAADLPLVNWGPGVSCLKIERL